MIIVFLVEDSKDEKNLLAGLNLHYVDAMALNDDEKGLSIEFSVLSSRRFAWNPEMQSLSFPKKLFVDPKTVSTTLYLFFRS